MKEDGGRSCDDENVNFCFRLLMRMPREVSDWVALLCFLIFVFLDSPLSFFFGLIAKEKSANNSLHRKSFFFTFVVTGRSLNALFLFFFLSHLQEAIDRKTNLDLFDPQNADGNLRTSSQLLVAGSQKPSTNST